MMNIIFFPMNKIFKAPIIFSLLAVSAFSIIGSEPSRAGNKYIKGFGPCYVVKTNSTTFKVKQNNSGKLWHTNSNRQAAIDWMKSSPKCCTLSQGYDHSCP